MIVSETPASKWEDAMLTGNGLIGVMQYGEPLNEVFIFNSHQFIYPNGAPFPAPDMSDAVEPMRDRMLAGDIGEGWAQYHRTLLERQGVEHDTGQRYAGMKWTQSFHPGYVMKIDMEPAGNVSDYSRTTDYQTGEIIVKWADDRGDWERRTFASRPDRVIVTRLIAPPGRALSCTISAEPAEKSKEEVTYQTVVSPGFFNVRAKYPVINDKQGGYEGVTRVVQTGGKTTVAGDTLQIDNATEVLLLTKLDRYRDDFSRWDDQSLQAELKEITTSYDELLSPHAAVQSEMFNRVDLSLFANEQDRSLSTEKLLDRKRAHKRTIDRALLEKLFYTSRYLFMASSGERYAPRLSGMFIGAWGAAWAGDYTNDANVNFAVIGGNIANLSECMEGYFQIIERTQPQWREGARQLYGSRGILGPIRIDGEVAVPLHVSRYHAHSTATGIGPWLLYPMFEHYQVTGDQRFLRERLYPLLKQQALFYEDFLTRTDDHGDLIFVPSNSPENDWPGIKPRTSAAINSTFDIAAAKQALNMLLKAEEDLGIPESESSRTWRAMLERMPPYLINKDDALKEWAWPGYGENYGHRHSSHMYTVWPAYEINPDSPQTAGLVPAVSKALDMRKKRGRLVHAHDVLMKSIARIRIKQADEFRELLLYLMKNGFFYRSLASSHDRGHHIYNYDLILSLQGLLIEMSVLTQDGMIELLPALPADFPRGRLAGIKGRNRVTIDELEWNLDQGRITCTLTSDIDQTITLIHRDGIGTTQSEAEIGTSDLGDFARTVELRAGERVDITVRIPRRVGTR